MAQVGKTDATVGGWQLGVRIFIQGSYTCIPAVCIGFLGAVGRDDEDGG